MKEELIDKSIKTGYLQLSLAKKIKYYRWVFVFACLALVVPVISIYLLVEGKPTEVDSFILTLPVVIFGGLAYMAYYLKRSKLKLMEIPTKLGLEDILKHIRIASKGKGWIVKPKKRKAILIKAYVNSQRNIIFDSDLMRIMIFLGVNKVLVYSWNYNYPKNRRTSQLYGINKENIELITSIIKEAEQTFNQTALEKLST